MVVSSILITIHLYHPHNPNIEVFRSCTFSSFVFYENAEAVGGASMFLDALSNCRKSWDDRWQPGRAFRWGDLSDHHMWYFTVFKLFDCLLWNSFITVMKLDYLGKILKQDFIAPIIRGYLVGSPCFSCRPINLWSFFWSPDYNMVFPAWIRSFVVNQFIIKLSVHMTCLNKYPLKILNGKVNCH